MVKRQTIPSCSPWFGRGFLRECQALGEYRMSSCVEDRNGHLALLGNPLWLLLIVCTLVNGAVFKEGQEWEILSY